MFLRIFILFSLILLFSTDLLAAISYKHMGSFKAGESITGLRSEQYGSSGLEYDFVVQQYGIVEFKPQKYTHHLAQYKIRDFENKSSGYFYVGAAEGITANGSNSYPDGWKIAMMPGTYKVIVFTDYYKDNPEPYFNMDTTFTPSSNQSPKTGTGFNWFDGNGKYIYSPSSILLNTSYSDNIGFYRGHSEKLPASSSAYTVHNTIDVFSFSLSAESDVVRSIQLNNNGMNVEHFLYAYIKNSDMKNVCHDFYTVAHDASTPTSTKTSSSCRLAAGDYFLEIRGSDAYDYNFQLQSTPVNATPSCEPFYLEKDKQTTNLNIGDVRYFNMTVCGDVEITSSDDSIATATESKTEFITEVEVKAIANGTATITVSDKNSVGTLKITVGDATPTNPITTSDTKEVIGNITFLEYEPDGYFTWSDADTFCKERGYRLPSMDELIYVWNNNGGKISPKGFEKDTFYWSSEVLTPGTNYFQGCAMDYDCSKADSWESSSNGHPKCVVSVDSSVKPDEPTTPDTLLSVPKANYDDFQTMDCGIYTSTQEGLKVNGTSYRYGNILATKKLYDVRDSVTYMKWKANSTSYSQFAPQIVGIAGSTMTTNHSYGGSTKIESDTWYYTTITVSGDKATIVTTKNSYNDADVVRKDEATIPEYRVPFIKNGVQLGFVMGDTYASTNAYFVLSEFDTTAKAVLFAYNKQVDLNQALTDIFSDIQGSWTLSDNRLSITNANLNDAVTLGVSNALVMNFTVASNQTQSNFAAVAIDKDENIISVVTVDPSASTCEKEYSLPLSNAVKVKFLFDKNYAMEHSESTSKDVVIQNIKLFANTPLVTIESFKEESDGNNQKVDVTMDDKTVVTINTPPNSEVNENQDKGITVTHTVNEDFGVKTTLNKNGSLLEEINSKLDTLLKKTEIIIDLLTKSTEMHSDGSTAVVSELNGFILNLFTDKIAKVTPNYSFNGKNVLMPTFNSGSKIHVKQESGNILIEVKTTLSTKLTF